jgi:dihydroxyacetone kinase-like protein
MTTTIDVDQTRRMLLAVARDVIAAEDLLCRADRAIGDGDHGTGMRRGFSAASNRLADTDTTFTTIEQLFRTVGTTLTATMGGASGVVFGLLFTGGPPRPATPTPAAPAGPLTAAGDTLAPDVSPLNASELDAARFARHLERARHEISRRGRAQPGDKTMLDALAPAVDALHDAADAGAALPEALRAATAAAHHGAEQTRNYRARFGKAAALGDRALGHPDPGALSMTLILNAMADWVATCAAAAGSPIPGETAPTVTFLPT